MRRILRAPARAGDPDALVLRRAARRLALQIAAMIAAIVLTVAGISFLMVAASQARSLDQALSAARDDAHGDELGHGTYVLREGHGQGAGAPSQSLPDGLPDESALAAVRAGEQRVDSQVSSGGRTYAVRTMRADEGIVQVAIDLHDLREQRAGVGLALGAGSLVGIAVAALVAERLARRAMSPLADALSRQRRFVADASHELRTPLTLLSTRVQILGRRARDAPEGVRTEIAAVESDARALTRLLEELLASVDERPIPLAAVDLRAAAREAAASAGAEAERSGIALEAAEGPAVMVKANAVALRQIVQSLLSNALDHAAASVRLSIAADHSTATLRVADDGPGFPDGMDPFVRFASHRSGEAAQHHYGLGLALVAELAHRLGGKVEVIRSLPGGVIEVTLPTAADGPIGS